MRFSSLRAPAAIARANLGGPPLQLRQCREVVDFVLATLAIHWNVLDVTACSAEPVIVIWLVCG